METRTGRKRSLVLLNTKSASSQDSSPLFQDKQLAKLNKDPSAKRVDDVGKGGSAVQAAHGA